MLEVELLEDAAVSRLRHSRSLTEMTRYTRDKLDVYSLLDVSSEEGNSRLDESIELAVKWERELNRNKVRVTDDDSRYAVFTFNTWLYGDYIKKPVIVAAPPAFGKSTMLSVFLKHMTEKYPDTFGAVVVKERIADVEGLAQEINEGSKRAFTIRGYDESTMTREQYEEQFTNQSGFNVVIMTTKQFELQTLKNNLHAFTEFRDEKGISRPRRLLLVDEKPALVVNYTLTVRGLNDFITDVAEAGRVLRGRLQPYYKSVLPIVNDIRTKLESADDYPQGKFPPVNPAYRLPTKLVRDYSEVFGYEKMKALRAFERVVRNGGEYHVYNGRASVVTTQIVHYRYTLFNTFILDGTGTKDPDYNSANFYLLAPEQMPTYSNVTFHI